MYISKEAKFIKNSIILLSNVS